MHAVQAASHGRLLWTADQIARAQRRWDDVGSKLEALDPREREVLDLVAEGLTNRQVAERLVIIQNTIQTHVHHILSQFGANNRIKAARVLARGANIHRTTREHH